MYLLPLDQERKMSGSDGGEENRRAWTHSRRWSFSLGPISWRGRARDEGG